MNWIHLARRNFDNLRQALPERWIGTGPIDLKVTKVAFDFASFVGDPTERMSSLTLGRHIPFHNYTQYLSVIVSILVLAESSRTQSSMHY